MGWCSGTDLFDQVVGAILSDNTDIKPVIKKLIEAFEDMDWDCQSDSNYFDDPIVREAFMELHPSWFEDD